MLSIMAINGCASFFLMELGRIKWKKEKMKKTEDKNEELVDKDNEEGKELEDK